MKDNWNELFDHLNEEDILRNLPEDLPEMEDALAAKRIEEHVMQEMKIDLGMQKKQKRKRILAAVVCCIVAVGTFGHKPILAAFQRLFYDLPGVGVYIDDENKTIYEVQIDDPVQEKDSVRVELMDFYCEGKQIYGTVRITGENLLDMTVERTNEEVEDALEEKFLTTWYYGEKEKQFHSSGRGKVTEDGKLKRYDQRGWEWLYLEKGIDTYYLEVEGFDRRFELKIVEPKVTEKSEELGYAVTKNDTTVVARASLSGENSIDLEYFLIPSDEVKRARERWYRFGITIAPYEFDTENYFYIENANGKRMKGKYESMGNGGKYHLQGTMEDFPLTLHYSPFTGTDGEEHSLSLPLPAKEEKQTEKLPTVKFHYGTVEILSVEQEDVIWKDSNELSERKEEATKVTVIYQTVPKEGDRRMYAVDMNLAEEEIFFDSNHSREEYVEKIIYHLPRAERDSLKVLLQEPSYWIEGEYDVVIEKPIEIK
ncbi:MAG: hypothetical protein ACI4AO_00535 [Anaerotignum sp.]